MLLERTLFVLMKKLTRSSLVRAKLHLARETRDEQRERKILFLRCGVTLSPPPGLLSVERRSEFSIPLSHRLDPTPGVTYAQLTSRLGQGRGRGRSHSVIRRRDGFTSWLVALLRDAEIEFIIRRYYTAACLQRLNRI